MTSSQEKFEELKNLYRQKYGEEPVGEVTMGKIEKYRILIDEVNKKEEKKIKKGEKKSKKMAKIDYHYLEPKTEGERRRQKEAVNDAYDILFNKVRQLRDEAHQRGEKWGLFE